MHKWLNEWVSCIFQLLQSAVVRTGAELRKDSWGCGGRVRASECEAVLYNAWPWEVLTLRKVQTPSTCFFHTRPNDFLCTLEDFHSLNYRERGWEKLGGKKKIRSAGIGLWRAVPYILGASWSQAREGPPSAPAAPIEDRFKVPPYVELQLIASHLCWQPELSHQTVSCGIYRRIKQD